METHLSEGVDMSKVAFLGLGAMGSRMAANLLKAGHTVTVWDRSPAAAEALVASGARKASSPKEAAERADFVFAIVRDDERRKMYGLAPI
jgi:3-hydroxyisobutyrate dehydrogenase